MYNKQWKGWESDHYEETLLLWCKESFNRDNPQALYILADAALGKASKGKETADAVYGMEQAANLGFAQAALAMGQMFQYGWAVHRSEKRARTWYEKAAALGSEEAAACLEEMRRNKQRRALLGGLMAAALCACVLGVIWLFPVGTPQGILVHEDTKLLLPVTLEEFQGALQELVEKYDDELVVSGQRSTNRVLLKLEGSGIDLTDFPAAEVIASQDHYLVIQFETEEEAQRCLDAMEELDGLAFVHMDTYGFSVQSIQPEQTTTGVPYSSPYSGVTYYSWGVEYLGLDRLAGWLMEQPTTPVTVAVLDTGVQPCAENEHLVLEGMDVTDSNGNGREDQQGHGTHVAGTIMDCTWGLDVSILPVRVFAGEQTSDSYIIQGLQFAIQSGVEVVNMSLGGVCASTEPGGTCGGPVDYYIQEACRQGIVVVVAAGNGDDLGNPIDTCGYCPAHLDDCIVVAACDSSGTLGSFSNYGDSVDVCAPGVAVTSYYPGDTFATLDGTSMAAPHISALAAMLKLYLPDRTAKQIETYICDYCVDMGDTLSYGAGIPWAGYFAGN